MPYTIAPFFQVAKMTSKPTSNVAKSEEISFKVDGLNISAKRWNKGAPYKAIALHGWLDNCASFDLIGPDLKEIELVALDSAGHGKSDFRSADGDYLIWAEVGEVFNVADQLGWDTFNLIGHSRGAGIAGISAGTFPERIERLILLEGGIPLPMKADDVPKNLAAHITNNRTLSGSRGTVFKTREEAISARADGFTKVSYAAAEILASRSLNETAEGVRWHADARLKAPSSLKLTHAQIDAFLSRISAPALLVLGQDGILAEMLFAERHLKSIGSLERVTLPGSHHLHMEESAPDCSRLIEEFIAIKN